MPSLAQQPAAVPVGTVAAELRAITQCTEFVGRVEAIEHVDVRARVTGFLQTDAVQGRRYGERGRSPLRIEPDTFQAAVMQARGALIWSTGHVRERNGATCADGRAGKDQHCGASDARSADVADGKKCSRRHVILATRTLRRRRSISVTRRLSLRSPARPVSRFTEGNLVGPDSGPTTEMVSRDPMYVTFPVSQREFLQVEKDKNEKGAEAALAVVSGSRMARHMVRPGQINFVDVSVDRATDTVLVRATLPNPDGRLIDGQLARVSVESEKPEDKVLVPQSALLVDQQGPYVFMVQDGKAAVTA